MSKMAHEIHRQEFACETHERPEKKKIHIIMIFRIRYFS